MGCRSRFESGSLKVIRRDLALTLDFFSGKTKTLLLIMRILHIPAPLHGDLNAQIGDGARFPGLQKQMRDENFPQNVFIEIQTILPTFWTMLLPEDGDDLLLAVVLVDGHQPAATVPQHDLLRRLTD